MKVHLRERISKKTGRVTLYLEIYKGHKKNVNGSIEHIRDYEYLDYYLYLNPKSGVEKQHNKENKAAAEAVKAQKILEIQNGIYGFANTHRLNANFIDYFQKLTDERMRSSGNHGNWKSTLKHLKSYAGEKVTFKDVTIEFLEGLRQFLLYKVVVGENKGLSTNAALSYFNKVKAALNQAFEEKIINDNPAKRVKGIQPEETKREYLTLEEIKSLMSTECRYDVLKRAFLFSCFSGLRWSDIEKLTWREVKKLEGNYRIEFIQKKTKGVEYLDIHIEAVKYLGERDNDLEKVFKGLKYSSYMNVALTQWMVKAKITKPITFHCARHSYATYLLSKGVDIYTVCKLLGHKELKTTQIYTKVIDKKKLEAINVFDEIFS
ncbi:MAG: site-specific integrase [Chitinophagales bacterium]|nr:site-specific integrase [Chitinophagales bacterium]